MLLTLIFPQFALQSGVLSGFTMASWQTTIGGASETPSADADWAARFAAGLLLYGSGFAVAVAVVHVGRDLRTQLISTFPKAIRELSVAIDAGLVVAATLLYASLFMLLAYPVIPAQVSGGAPRNVRLLATKNDQAALIELGLSIPARHGHPVHPLLGVQRPHPAFQKGSGQADARRRSGPAAEQLGDDQTAPSGSWHRGCLGQSSVGLARSAVRAQLGGQHAAVAPDRLHREALSAPAHPDLVGDEPTEPDPGVAEQGDEPPRDRALADPGPALQQHPQRIAVARGHLLHATVASPSASGPPHGSNRGSTQVVAGFSPRQQVTHQVGRGEDPRAVQLALLTHARWIASRNSASSFRAFW